jgi:hypothetical protein
MRRRNAVLPISWLQWCLLEGRALGSVVMVGALHRSFTALYPLHRSLTALQVLHHITLPQAKLPLHLGCGDLWPAGGGSRPDRRGLAAYLVKSLFGI